MMNKKGTGKYRISVISQHLERLNEAPKVHTLSHSKTKFEASKNVVANCEAGPAGVDKDEKQSGGADFMVKPVDGSDASPAFKPDLPKKGSDVVDVGANSLAVKVEKVDEVENPNSELCKNMPVL
ncbi:hypothetical protein L3X38_027122 [Prunus dulcis]|uniref:Uncharacterized protein n=1 Tax=Prunus dulcis TaxID=3755 RepID=A0AAD4Z003_PRUDU|nr:hypothetical protein L3X38_027122 [Prunus dulcis]